MSELILYNNDCLEAMDDLIAKEVKVGCILVDPPYGMTACKWDSVIPLDEMWKRVNKLLPPNRVAAIFGSEPFSSTLRMSNLKAFRYDWIWSKGRGHNFASLKYQPFKSHEIVSVFSTKAPFYNAQKSKGKPYKQKQGCKGEVYGGDNKKEIITINNGDRHPLSVQTYSRTKEDRGHHPTQKPVPLLEYFIKTYTNEGDTILDFAGGSFSTAIACINLKRKFIGIEKGGLYYVAGRERLIQYLTLRGYSQKYS